MNTLYTYGGGEVLYKIFNAIAAICRTDSPYWTSWVYPSIAITGLWAYATNVSSNQISIFGKQWFLPGFIVLNALLLPKASLYIIDEVNPSFGSDKVDNLPAGLVTFVGAASMISTGFTELIETALYPEDAGKYTRTGFGFAARITQEARTIRIKDPRIRKNVKAWCDQCIWLPYLQTNIQGKREEVRKSEDLLSWVKANAHPSLGIYWEKKDGESFYMTCKTAAILIESSMALEGQKGVVSLVGSMFGASNNQLNMNRVKGHMKEAWQMMSQSTRSVHQQVQQMMLINAQKEAFDDAREKSNKSRLYPELVSLNATRALEAKGLSGFMNSLLASKMLPMLQATILGLLAIFFILLAPFYFMSGGTKVLALWLKVMFATQLWPLFSTTLNSISQMWQSVKSQTILQGDEGFSIATTSGLVDLAEQAGAWAAGMEMMAPVLAFAFVTGSSYVFSNIFSGMMSDAQGSAGRFASEAVDGNLSVGNQNLLNETVGSRSIAQQSHASNSNFASTLNTGGMIQTSSVGGGSVFQENQSSFKSNISSSDATNATIGDGYRNSQQLVEQDRHSYTNSLQNATQSVLSLVESSGKDQSLTDGFSESEKTAFNTAMDDIQSSTKALSERHGVDAQTMVSAGISAKMGGVVGKVFGIEGSGGINGSAINQEGISQALNSDEGKRLSKGLQSLSDLSHSHGGQMINKTGQSLTDNLNSSLNKVESSANDLSHSYMNSQNWDQMKNYNDTHGVDVRSNENDAFVDYAADKMGVSRADAVDRLSNPIHGQETQGIRGEFIKERQDSLRSLVEGSNHVLTPEEVQGFLSKTPTSSYGGDGRDQVYERAEKENFMSAEKIQKGYDELRSKTEESLTANDDTFHFEKEGWDKSHGNLGSRFENENRKSNVRRLAEKGGGDILTTTGIDKFLNEDK